MPLWGRKADSAPQDCIRSAIIIHHRDKDGKVTGDRSYGLGLGKKGLCLLPGASQISGSWAGAPISAWAKLWFYYRLSPRPRYPDPRHQQFDDSAAWYRHFSLPASVEVFGHELGIKGVGDYLLADGKELHFQWWPNDGTFLIGDGPAGYGVAIPGGAVVGAGEAGALAGRAECVDQGGPASRAETAPLDMVVGSVLGILDVKQVGYVKALIATRMIRFELENKAAEAKGTRDLAASLLESEKSLSVQADRQEHKLAGQSLQMIAESLNVVSGQEKRIERMIDRIRDYRLGLRARRQEAQRAADVASATSDALAMAARVTGGVTSAEEIDSAEDYVASVSRSLEERIAVLKGLVSEIRSDTEVDSELAALRRTEGR